MKNLNLTLLKSGTDIRGVAAKSTSGDIVTLTDGAVSALTYGFVYWLSGEICVPIYDLTIAVGHDSRVSAGRISEAVICELTRLGVRVLFCGLSCTPAMFLTTVDLGANGAVSITASHHPLDRNGLKFFTRSGGINSDDIERVIDYAYLYQISNPGVHPGEILHVDYMKQYAAKLRDMVLESLGELPLAGLKIVVDAGHGVGGFYASDVLAPLGADISASQFLQPDGTFPAHKPNPEDKVAMHSLKVAVLESGADLGVIFDTDADRVAIVDAQGQEINKNKLIALAAEIVLRESSGATIVTDSVTSTGLTKYIEGVLGGRHHRFKRGYRNVINEAIRLGTKGINCPLAIETSGHAALKEHYFLDDGAYLVTKIIIEFVIARTGGSDLIERLSALPEPAVSLAFRIPLKCADFAKEANEVIDRLCRYAKGLPHLTIDESNCEGVRVKFLEGAGWFLLRQSIHDPVLILSIETDVLGAQEEILREVSGVIGSQSDWDPIN